MPFRMHRQSPFKEFRFLMPGKSAFPDGVRHPDRWHYRTDLRRNIYGVKRGFR